MMKCFLLGLLAAFAPAAGCDQQPQPTAGPATTVSAIGISLHDPASTLARHPSLKEIGDGMFADHSRGVEFGIANDRVAYILLRWDDPNLTFSDPAAERHGAFSGEFSIAARPLSFTTLTREEDVIASLGEPYWRDVDDGEVLLFYEYPGVEIQIELAEGGPIRVLLATDEPLMADAQQRAAYGVTKSWPANP